MRYRIRFSEMDYDELDDLGAMLRRHKVKVSLLGKRIKEKVRQRLEEAGVDVDYFREREEIEEALRKADEVRKMRRRVKWMSESGKKKIRRIL